jgi:hypothetical protein
VDPEPGPGYAALLDDVAKRHDVHGNLVADAMLAALAIEHGVALCSSDTDFAGFAGLRRINPWSEAFGARRRPAFLRRGRSRRENAHSAADTAILEDLGPSYTHRAARPYRLTRSRLN